jgi:hypothetical protein
MYLLEKTILFLTILDFIRYGYALLKVFFWKKQNSIIFLILIFHFSKKNENEIPFF